MTREHQIPVLYDWIVSRNGGVLLLYSDKQTKVKDSISSILAYWVYDIPPPPPNRLTDTRWMMHSVSRRLTLFPRTNFMVPILGWIYLGVMLNKNKEINSPPKAIRTHDQRLVSNPPTSLLRLHALVSFCLFLSFFVVGSHHFTRISPYVVQPCLIPEYTVVL